LDALPSMKIQEQPPLEYFLPTPKMIEKISLRNERKLKERA
jgi:hypothetical protein